MNLIIKLPPKDERESMVTAWIEGLKHGDYERFEDEVESSLQSGCSHHGITCLFLHEMTTKVVRSRLSEHYDSPWVDAAFGSPICLN